MNLEKLLEWGAIVVVAILGLRWIGGLLSGDLAPLVGQSGSVGGYTNITPVSGPVIVTPYYGGGWNGVGTANGPYSRYPYNGPRRPWGK